MYKIRFWVTVSQENQENQFQENRRLTLNDKS